MPLHLHIKPLSECMERKTSLPQNKGELQKRVWQVDANIDRSFGFLHSVFLDLCLKLNNQTYQSLDMSSQFHGYKVFSIKVSRVENFYLLDNWKEDIKDVPLLSAFWMQIATLDRESPFMQHLIAFPINYKTTYHWQFNMFIFAN